MIIARLYQISFSVAMVRSQCKHQGSLLLTSVKADTSVAAVGIGGILLKVILSTKLPVAQHVKMLKV
ncbi:MAG: hypothetical protein Q8K74_02415 [Candidatus Nitrotoga sp.]|nr:hypothetical protein [Candidatus Nitrotoga sp.]MDO9448567.1 hypothetical protein [Candidatus Nitrotoga sp.]MDP1636689.1 hypothetical protein [Candidatus Nitrotoga sp.]MDP1854888.1 hypothetical protein [Candidatus Nitrotoga sp.]MDP3497540.1 hypothetical protein [Candidatus Nitrotoga sp.]